MKKKAKEISEIKERLSCAARGAENPASLVGHACWGYFAADVLRLIEDHSRIETALQNRRKNGAITHSAN